MDTGSGYRGRIPFPPLQLTVEEQERCQELTMQLLDQTLRSYDERGVAANGSPLHHSCLASARWKRVKTQHNASLYCERHRGGPHDLHMPWGSWKSPLVLLAVGTIQGSLDDVMLGLTTQSFGDMQLRAASMASQEIRGAMLAKISGPTEEDPFNSQSVVWMVGEQKWPLSMVVHPRDFVNLWAFGVITTASGDRIGYEVVQPAQLPQCPELPGSIKRGKFMYGALFREQGGTVDAYIQVHVETMGSVVNAVMMNAMWSSTLGFWKSPRLSEEKRLECSNMEAGEGYRGHIPFHPLQLTFAEQERYQELTLQRLDWTLRSYDERGVTTRGSPRHHSNQDSARRKRHKTQSNASLYSERDHSGRRDLHMPGDNWENPAVLLAVGTIQASLDDVMFGLTTQTFGTCVSNLSVMWMVDEQGWPFSMIVRPRDFIILSASGIITRANGDRIGYDLEQDGTVDVYIQVYVETMGHILDTIVMNAMWIAVLGFWEAPRLAEDKKLQWCILN
ncbi:hypothetical protein JG687_00009024, partial [Phytophthora cactorum]